jgi:beta-xylosidase
MLNTILHLASFALLATAVPMPPPAVGADFADPSIINVDNTWYAFATSGRGNHVQVAVSQNFDQWSTSAGDALPNLPTWVEPGTDIWGPDVIRRVSRSQQWTEIVLLD